MAAAATLLGACGLAPSSPSPTITSAPTIDGVTGPPATGSPATGEPVSELILCEGEVFDGYEGKPFVLAGGVAADPTVRKVIRGCTFRNGSQAAIVLDEAVNVLIEDSVFEDIRSGVPGRGVFAIYIRGDHAIEDVTIRNNTFRRIGADAMQLGDTGRLVSDIRIEGNTFIGDGVGENAIDVKGVGGPVVIRGNTWSGYRPCLSPSKGGTQDCSGSEGAGVVIHEGEGAGRAHDVTVVDNVAFDNTRGIVVNHADGVTIAGNTFRDSIEVHIFVGDVTGCDLGANVFEGTGEPVVDQGSDCATP